MKLSKNTSYLLNFGRAEGKTYTIVKTAIKNATSSPNTLSIIVVPNIGETVRVFGELHKHISKTKYLVTYNNYATRTLSMSNGASIRVVASTQFLPDVLRGLSINYLYVDEINAKTLRELCSYYVSKCQIKAVVMTLSVDINSPLLRSCYQYIKASALDKQAHYVVKPSTRLEFEGTECTLGLSNDIRK